MKKRKYKASSEEEETDTTNEIVFQQGNRIFFYADVTLKSIQLLFECLAKANEAALSLRPSKVHLHIHSHGGDAYAGLAAFHNLKRNPIPITTMVDGMAASAATFLLLAGKVRVAMKHSSVLIHQVSTGFFGKYNDMIDEMQNTHDLMNTFRSLYKEHTSLTAEHLEELLKSERALDAKTCKKNGIVHKVSS